MKSLAVGTIVMCATLSAMAEAKTPEAPIDPGPRPTDADFRAVAERAALSGFFDPGSAQIQWPFGLVGGYFKPVLQGKKVGWWTCGQVNGKNRMGGYVGFRFFVTVVRNGAVVFSAIGDGSTYDFISIQCQQAVGKGVLTAASAPSARAVATSPSPDAPQFGFATTVVSDGVYIAQVTPNSVAASVGLTAGMVFTKVNGLSVVGMDASLVASILRAAEGETTFEVIGKGPVKLTKAPIATAH